MSFRQPDLPYAMGALVPFLSEEQVNFHYSKHHAGYFAKLNSLVSGTSDAEMMLEDLVAKSEGTIFNNAAQALNHSFYWKCLKPNGGGTPIGDLGPAIERYFHSFDQFMDDFTKAAATLFGSGWVWLTADDKGRLDIMPLSNADTPRKHGKRPILTLDVWEHAYYIDYRNDRLRYINGFWTVVNWEFAEEKYKAAIVR
jgi:Fe-Mn family superoxide dismutase